MTAGEISFLDVVVAIDPRDTAAATTPHLAVRDDCKIPLSSALCSPSLGRTGLAEVVAQESGSSYSADSDQQAIRWELGKFFIV